MTNIADKIRKIIAKANDTSHPEEASAFMGKAMQMLEAHGLNLLDIGKLDDDPVGVDRDTTSTYVAESWASILAGQLALYFGCQIVATRVGNKITFAVAGRESARVTYTLMFPFVVRQVRALAREGVKAGDFSTESRAKTAIGNALALRIHSLVQDKEAAPTQSKETSAALVPVDMIALAVEEEFGKLRTGTRRNVSTTTASRAAAGKVSLHAQANAPANAKRIST